MLADPLRRECYRRLALERKCPSNALLIAGEVYPDLAVADGLAALDALGLKPTVFHLNEGHAAFVVLHSPWAAGWRASTLALLH